MQKMSEAQFQDWKDNSDFFFNHIKDEIDRLEDQFKSAGQQLGLTSTDKLEDLRLAAIRLEGHRFVLQGVLEVQHADIFGGDDD